MTKQQKTKNKKQITGKKSAKTVNKSSILAITPKSLPEPQTMEELLQQTGIKQFGLKKGNTVNGTVILVSPREILVDIGRKSYGIVAEWELDQVKDYAANLKVGERVVAQVVNPENDFGYVILSLRKTSLENRWGNLEDNRQKGGDIEVTGLEIAKGGILVDWQGLRGFIPITQLEGNIATSPQNLIGKKVKVKVIEVDRSMNRLVLSQKASVHGVTPTNQKAKLSKIKPGDTLKGVVSGIAPFGVFIDVDGLEGLVHISEVAWEKVENLPDLYKIGESYEVVVLEVNNAQGKLNLSIKRLTPDPWKNILDKYPLETKVTGKIVRTAPYGVFVQIEPGIEGLLHISKLTDIENVRIGDIIDCLIEGVDPVRRKISLTLVPKEKPVGYR